MTPRKLPWPLQVLYGVGEIPITATMGLFGLYVLFFYTTVMGLPGSLAGLGVSAGLVVDAVIDPYIGYRSDKSRAGLGRRQAFMLFGCIGMGPAFFFLLSPPRGMGQWVLFAWLLVWSLAFRFSFASYRIPYLSLGAELTTDYDERTRVIAVRSLIGLLGMAAGATLPLLLFFRKTGAGDAKLQYAGYPRMGLFFGLVMTAAGLVAVFGTQSRKTIGDNLATGAGEFFRGMALFFRNRNFRALWLAFTLCSLAVVVNFTMSVAYLKWYVGLENQRTLSIVQGAFYVGAVVGVGAWMWIAKRGEKRTFFIASVLGLVAVLSLASLLVGAGHLFGTGKAWPLIGGNFIAGLFASALWVLPFSMMADVVDEDQAQWGLRREGVCFGIMNFGEKIASGGALLLSGMLTQYFIRSVPGSENQAADVVQRIGLSYGLVPGILLSLAVLLVLGFKLTRARVRQLQESRLVGAGQVQS